MTHRVSAGRGPISRPGLAGSGPGGNFSPMNEADAQVTPSGSISNRIPSGERVEVTLSMVRCQLLGKAEIHTRGIRLTPESQLQFGLALYFCTQAGRPVTRDEVARLFWPLNSIESARHNLRQSLYRLRVLGIPVRSGAKTSVLDAHMVESDFAPVVAEGAPASVYLRMTDVAVLPGYSPHFSRAFARWVEEFREEIGTKVRRGLVRAITEMRARGRYADVERLCRFCLALDPLNEEATLALAESVALSGGKLEAVGMIDRYRGELPHYPRELRLPASLLRERISDRLIRRSQAQIELPMIGREADVERVVTAYQLLKGNKAVSYVVEGAAGVGKTRLAMECSRIAELQGARVLTIGTQPSSRTQALYVVSELVDGMLQLPGAIGCAPAALECLRGISAPLTVREPMLSLEPDAEARFAMVRWSILDVLDAILSESPLVIHVDDAHQMDAQSQLILQDAMRAHADRPLMLLLSMRRPEPGDAERFARLRDASTVHLLEPLTDDSCDRLVHRFCEKNEEVLDDVTRERIIHLSGGNPLFLLELLKHRSDLSSGDLPPSVQALLEERLRRLSKTALTVLRAAAVLGLSSNVDRLQRVLSCSTTVVLSALAELHTAGMLSSSHSGTVCRHDTIRESVLCRTPLGVRQLLNRRAAAVLGHDALRLGGVAEIWQCLSHWREAGTPEKGAPLALRFTRSLIRIGLYSDALNLLEAVERTADNSRTRSRALQLKIPILRSQRKWLDLLHVAGEWRRARTESRRPTPQHSRYELYELQASILAGPDGASGIANALGCLRDYMSSTEHKLAAASLIMLAAQNECDVQLAHHVWELVKDLRGDTLGGTLDRLLTEAIYHGSFGDVLLLPPCLTALVSSARLIPHPVVRATYLRRAAFGIGRFISPDAATPILLESLNAFETLELWSSAVLCIEDLATLTIHCERFAEAGVWLQRALLLNERHDDPYSHTIAFEIATMLAYESGHSPGGLDIPTSIAVLDKIPLLRIRQNLLTLRAARSMVLGQVPSKEDCRLLLHYHDALRGQNDQDFPTSVLVRTLLVTGQRAAASSVVDGYLSSERREALPHIGSLRQLAVELGRTPGTSKNTPTATN